MVDCSATGTIERFDATFMRAPDRICFGTAELVQNLIGKNVKQLNRRDINRCAGGGEGCAHLLDISRDTLAELAKSLNAIDGLCR